MTFSELLPSREAAAVRVLKALIREGGRAESGGFIVETDGAFRYSNPVTQGSPNCVHYTIAVPNGSRLAGLYHTHVADARFSPHDKRQAAKYGVPSFIGTLRDELLLRYDPATGCAVDLGRIDTRGGQADSHRFESWGHELAHAVCGAWHEGA